MSLWLCIACTNRQFWTGNWCKLINWTVKLVLMAMLPLACTIFHPHAAGYCTHWVSQLSTSEAHKCKWSWTPTVKEVNNCMRKTVAWHLQQQQLDCTNVRPQKRTDSKMSKWLHCLICIVAIHEFRPARIDTFYNPISYLGSKRFTL